MYTYKILKSKNPVTMMTGLSTVRLEITNTHTNVTKACDDFTYLDDDSQEQLEYLFKNNFGENEIIC